VNRVEGREAAGRFRPPEPEDPDSGLTIMRCEQAHQLFDAYLDGELSPSLATELGAHRVRCADCRQALAILEVSGHILASDHDGAALEGDFSDRLLACMDGNGLGWGRRLLRGLYVGGPLAAAAMIGLAFLGVFDTGQKTRILGEKHIRSEVANVVPDSIMPAAGDRGSGQDQALDIFLQQAEKSLDAKRQSWESLQKAPDLTVLQLLEMLNALLEPAEGSPPDEAPFPGADAPASATSDIEDL